MDMELTPIEFIAQMINDQKARAEGYVVLSIPFLALAIYLFIRGGMETVLIN